MKIIAFHSYKGGTGKTHLSSNIGVLLAKLGHRVAILDLDFRGPNCSTLFNYEPENTINDYLFGEKTAQEVLVDFSDQLGIDLTAGFASTDFRKIGNILRADRRQRQLNLTRILRLKDELSDQGFEYVLVDTAPGCTMESIDGLVISDAVVLVLRTDDSDIAGTKSMVQQLYTLLDSKNFLVVNRMVGSLGPPGGHTHEHVDYLDEISSHWKEMMMEVLKVIPCFCEVARAGGKELFVIGNPEHPFTVEMQDLANILIEKLRG